MRILEWILVKSYTLKFLLEFTQNDRVSMLLLHAVINLALFSKEQMFKSFHRFNFGFFFLLVLLNCYNMYVLAYACMSFWGFWVLAFQGIYFPCNSWVVHNCSRNIFLTFTLLINVVLLMDSKTLTISIPHISNIWLSQHSQR